VSAKAPAKKVEPEPAEFSESSSEESEEESDSGSESESEDPKAVKKTATPSPNKPSPLPHDSPIKSTESHEVMVNDSNEESQSDGDDEKFEKDNGPKPSSTQQELASPSPSPNKPDNEIEDQANIETQSNNSSIRDSRSPVRYNELSQPFGQPNELSSPESEQIPAKQTEREDSSSVSDSDSDVEMKDAPLHSSADKVSDSEGDDDNTIQIPKSSLPVVSTKKTSVRTFQEKAAAPKQSTSKDQFSPSGSSLDTQEEIDDQLISSMIEALPDTSSPAPGSSVAHILNRPNTNGNSNNRSSPPRPSFGFGASLKVMNEKKKAFSSSAPAFGLAKGKKPLSLVEKMSARNSEEDSNSSSDSNSDSSDDDDDNKLPPSSAPRSTQIPRKTRDDAESESDSDSSSSGSSGSGSEDERPVTVTAAQRKLQDEIAQMYASSQANNHSSPSVARGLRKA